MSRYLIIATICSLAIGGCGMHQHRNATPSSVAGRESTAGWYLMQPPLRGGTPDPAAPLHDWQSIAFFDHSAQCDTARARGLSAYSSIVQVAALNASDSIAVSARLAELSLCVAADDPRINWFHTEFKWK